MRYCEDVAIAKTIVHVIDGNADGAVNYLIKQVRNIHQS